MSDKNFLISLVFSWERKKVSCVMGAYRNDNMYTALVGTAPRALLSLDSSSYEFIE